MGVTPIPHVPPPELIDVTGFTVDGSREYLPAGGPARRRRPTPYHPPVPPKDPVGTLLNLAITVLLVALLFVPIAWWIT